MWSEKILNSVRVLKIYQPNSGIFSHKLWDLKSREILPLFFLSNQCRYAMVLECRDFFAVSKEMEIRYHNEGSNLHIWMIIWDDPQQNLRIKWKLYTCQLIIFICCTIIIYDTHIKNIYDLKNNWKKRFYVSK